jgi:phage-related protein
VADASLYFNLVARDRVSGVVDNMVANIRRAAPIAGAALGAGVVGAASPVVLGGLAALAASGAQVLAAGGVLGIGVALAAQTQQVKDAADDMKSAFTDAFAPLGEILAPAVADALGIFKTLAQPIADALRPVLESLEPAIRPLAQGLTDLAKNALPGFTALAQSGAPFFATLAPLLPEIGAAMSDLMMTMAGVQPLFQSLITGALSAAPAVIRAVATGIDYLVQAFDGFRSGLTEGVTSTGWFGFFERMGAGARELYDRISELWNGPFGAQLREVGGQVFDLLAKVSPTFAIIKALISGDGIDTAGLKEKFQPIITGVMSIVDAVKTQWPVIEPVLRDIGSKLTDAFRVVSEDLGPIMTQIIGIIGSALELIGAIVGPVLQGLAILWRTYGEDITRIVSGAYEIVKSVIVGVLTTIQGYLDLFVGIFTGDWDRAGKGAIAIWQGMASTIVGVGRGLWQMISGIVSMIATGVQNGMTQMRDAAVSAWQSMRDRAAAAGNSLLDYARGLPGRLLSALGNMAIKFYSVGSDIIAGIRSGITGAASRLAEAAKDAVSDALAAAKSRLGIKSPSAVFRDEVGAQMMAGAEGGVEDGAQSLARTTASAMPGPSAVSVGSPSRQGGGVVVLRIDSAGSALDEVLVQVLRMAVSRAGGDVQLVLGSA